MRTCAKMRCDGEPVSTIKLAYDERVVLVGDLTAERDPNLLDLCWEHAQRMTPPVGWTIRDQRTADAAVR